MELRNAVEQSVQAGRRAAREKIEQNQPFSIIAFLFAGGVVALVRAARERDIFGIVLCALIFFVVGPYLPYGVIGEITAE